MKFFLQGVSGHIYNDENTEKTERQIQVALLPRQVHLRSRSGRVGKASKNSSLQDAEQMAIPTSKKGWEEGSSHGPGTPDHDANCHERTENRHGVAVGERNRGNQAGTLWNRHYLHGGTFGLIIMTKRKRSEFNYSVGSL